VPIDLSAFLTYLLFCDLPFLFSGINLFSLKFRLNEFDVSVLVLTSFVRIFSNSILITDSFGFSRVSFVLYDTLIALLAFVT
jgi:hypothetical protein